MADLINATLRDEMKRDERIVIFGEDVADCSREEYLKQKLVKGQGRRLQADLWPAMRIRLRPRVQLAAGGGQHRRPRYRHGDARAEAGGRDSVLRLHLAGDDAAARRTAADPLALEQCILLRRLVIRVAIGGYLTGGAIYHSQCGESMFTHTPGLRVVFPSNALDAAGLLRTAIRCDDPVLFPRAQAALSRDLRTRAVSRAGLHDSVRQGEDCASRNDLTVITYGAVVPRALQAAQKLEREHGVKRGADRPALAESV